MLNAGASIVSYTYYGAEKVVDGYNIMGAAKAALEANIRYLAKDLGKIDVRINGISAGPIKTLSAKGIKDFNSILDVVEEKAPLHKNVIPKQVGDATSFLFSDMASAITGEIIHVDNGFSIIGVSHRLSRFFSVQFCTDYLAFFSCNFALIISLFFRANF